MNERPSLPSLMGGGHVMAIVPQTFEETFRIARAVVAAGLAPSALIGKKTGDDAASAVAVAIMSGAELGLQPMVALRSFTVINGKPALYGDGLINVVRMSGRVAYLRTGSEERKGKLVGYCEAKRSDTGEEKRVEFSQDEAMRAGLWQSDALVRKQVWENNQRVWRDGQTNDSPWYRYPQRMLAWRAAGYCLRELFGDVLGGIRDEFEAREIAGEVIEHVHEEPAPAKIAPPSPPKPPSPPSPKASKEADADPSEIVTETGESTDALMESEPSEGEAFDYGKFFEDFQIALAGAKTAEQVEAVWVEFDIEAEFEGDDESRQLADQIKSRRLLALHPARAG